jgi:hypothetical protein
MFVLYLNTPNPFIESILPMSGCDLGPGMDSNGFTFS